MANIVTDNGKVVTPADKAKEIIENMNQSLMIELPGTSKFRVEMIVRYLNRDKISARSEAWFKKNYDSLVTDAIVELVEARERAITSYLVKKEFTDKNVAFTDLLARGVALEDASMQVYGTKVPPSKKEQGNN